MTGNVEEMSYARWSSDSDWYAFWCDSGDSISQNEEVLCLWHKSKRIDFTFEEVMSIGVGKLMNLYPNVSDNDIVRAMLIIQMFKDDVIMAFMLDDMK